MATYMSPDLSRRLGSAVQALALAQRMALVKAVEDFGASTEGPGELAYYDLPIGLQDWIDNGIKRALEADPVGG